MKKVLILNSFIKKYTGSEIMTLELARTFYELGYNVSVAGFDLGNPLVSEFNSLPIKIINIYNLKDNEFYDVIWAHHFITLEYCLLDKKILSNKIIFSSLSPYTALECPPFILDRVSIFLANSSETKNKLINMGISSDSIHLFPNPVPSYFFNFKKHFENKEIRKIAIISNHLPQELLEFFQMCTNSYISVDIIGIGFKEKLVTPSLLLNYDAIITIGKTVQYCLSLGIPVYCYDMFGGSGWITSKNIEENSKYNFTGRESKTKKEPIQIFKEIQEHNINHYDLNELSKYANYHYNMTNLVIDILNTKYQTKNSLDSTTLYQIAVRQRDFYSNQLFGDNFAQLFLKTNGEFTEKYSIRKKIIANSLIELVFPIENNNFNEFRLDLSNQSAFISSLSISLIYEDESMEEVIDYYYENMIFINRGEYLSISNDPIITFNSKKEKKIKFILCKYYLYSDYRFEEHVSCFLRTHHSLIKDKERLAKEIIEKSNNIITLENKIETNESEYKIALQIKDNLIYKSKVKLRNLSNQIYKSKVKLRNLSNQSARSRRELKAIIKEKNDELNRIKSSRGYKSIMKLKNLFKITDYTYLKYSRFFDARFYLENNKDVKEENIDPITHFLEYGWKEGRNPSKEFDLNDYITRYPDIKEANVNPLIHYIKYGKKEGRKIKPLKESSLVTFKKIISLIKENPTFISKFIFLVKTKGISYAILKVKSKITQQIDIENNVNIHSFDGLFPLLDSSNLEEIYKFYQNKGFKNPIDIIIPVYNGFEFLNSLFNSIKNNTSLPYRLLIADDKSPDNRVIPFIENFIAENPDIKVIFVKNIENQGFLKTVNLLAQHAENHIVLLNTDTEVPKFWLERLMYPIFTDESIASTTPFTNSGTICSFPNYLVDNKDIYGNLNLEQVDSVFQLVNTEKTMLQVPTGVGFCMGMNFNVVKQIGMFDEIYGKGYGEENDWCQRAINAGYRNIHITNLFVYHKHGGSFLSEDKIRYINEHYQILLGKFPAYDEQIQMTIKENSLEGLRNLVRCIIDFKYITRENVFIVDHELGGGANLYRKQKIDEMLSDDKGVILFSYNINKNKYYISFFTKEFRTRFTLYKLNILQDIFNILKLDKILLNGLVSFPNIYESLDLVLKIKDKTNAKLIFPVHDYFCISPSYTLLTENNVYNGVPKDLDAHSYFLSNSKAEFKLFCTETNAKKWRESWEIFLLSCDEVLCFSHSSEEIVLATYCELKDKLVYIPHDIKGTFYNIYDEIDKDGKRVIGILGNINLPKGSLVIKELVSYIDNRGLDIQIVLIGNIDINITSNAFVKTGTYQKKDVPELLKKYKITEFLIPSIWPETYSYTTDEIMQLGYPITVFELGAPAERVRLYEKGRLINLHSGKYIEEICKKWC